MAEQVASGDAAELALTPEQEAYFAQHGSTPQQEQVAEPQQEQPPVEPTEAEAVQPTEEAPSAEAPSQELEAAPDEARSASEADWKRWFGLAAKSLETGRPQWSQIPKGLRESVAAALDAEMGGTTAVAALNDWSGRAEFTPEEVAERENLAAQRAREEAAQQAQWEAYNAQVWSRFANLDPDFNAELNGDDYDLFEAQRVDQQGYAHYQQLKQEYAIQNDPQARMEYVATQRATAAQKDLLGNLLGEFITQDFISTVPSIKARMEQARSGEGFLESQGYEQSMAGFVQFFMGALKEASEYHSSARATKKVMEKTADIQAAAERAARGKALQQGLIRDSAGTGSAAPSYMPPADALAGGSALTKWIVSNPDKYKEWKARNRPGFQGQGWQGRQGAWSQRG